MSTLANLDHRGAVEHPEPVTTALAQHALGAARQALAVVHPETEAYGALDDIDYACLLALLIADDIVALDRLLAEYRLVVERQWCDRRDAPLPR
jgi:hypothetical protein